MGIFQPTTMTLLRTATRLGTTGVRILGPASSLRVVSVAPVSAPLVIGSRSFVNRSRPRCGHNLEDHFDMAEFVCKMHNPLGEYILWFAIFLMFGVAFGPLMHSNYYFTGRFVPKDQGNTQLCDDSW